LLGGGGGDVDDEGGGVFGIVDGGGQLALASITDPSGHVLVVGDVGGTDVGGGGVVDGLNVCVHDGSFGFFVQSTGGGVPEVQLPAAHVDAELFPPDVEVDVLLGGIADDVLLSGVAAAPAVVLVRLLLAPLLIGCRYWAHASDSHFVYAFSGVSGKSLAHANSPLSSFARSAADSHFVHALGSVGGHGPV